MKRWVMWLVLAAGCGPSEVTGSRDTGLENIFGPTPCRSLRYCRDCKQPFEQFKPL